MASTKLLPKQGRLLVSEPFLTDWYFKRSVVLITEHNDDGSLGFILNKPIDVTIQEVIPDFPEFNGSLYVGGPVKKDSLFFLHTAGDMIPGSQEIMDGLFWGGDFDVLQKMITLGRINESQVRFMIGYSGWAAEQLDKELTEQSWIVSKTKVPQIMKSETKDLWKDILSGMGTTYAMLSNFPENPSMN